jgi:valyl-tRNA synthetase
MTLLQPFMPFITEEIWHHLKERKAGEDCMVSTWPATQDSDAVLIKQIEQAKNVVSRIREIRNSKGIKMKEELEAFVYDDPSAQTLLEVKGWREMVMKMANLSSLQASSAEIENSVCFLADTETFYVVLAQEIDTEAECARLKEELAYYEGFLKQVSGKLSNERFVNNAPAAVVDKERQKLADGEAKLKSIEESLGQLGC